MASSKGKLKKVLGPVSKVISVIPDTTEIINKTIDNTRPIIEKHMDQRHEKQMNLVKLDDVVNLPVDEAKAHLETLGFVVSRILVKPEAKYHNAQLNEVVRMSPTSSKEPKGSLVKLY
ncbi:hypothetical protein HMPREF9318_00397 [Streptococcus urinalis FB127-CNA-2]|nr:hypothetical protein HMPREF9318_00397 [Streptococcus urinalis FB127-CNA-2]